MLVRLQMTSRLVLGTIGLIWLAVAAPGPASAAEPEEEVGSVFARIETAWRQGDQETLAALVHPGGLRVAIGGAGDRSAQYSPSQAFYFFRNLFQSYRTLSFAFQRTQDGRQGQRVHGLAAWQRRRPSSENVTEEKLVFLLVRHEDRLMLSEITTLK